MFMFRLGNCFQSCMLGHAGTYIAGIKLLSSFMTALYYIIILQRWLRKFLHTRWPSRAPRYGDSRQARLICFVLAGDTSSWHRVHSECDLNLHYRPIILHNLSHCISRARKKIRLFAYPGRSQSQISTSNVYPMLHRESSNTRQL